MALRSEDYGSHSNDLFKLYFNTKGQFFVVVRKSYSEQNKARSDFCEICPTEVVFTKTK